MLKLDNFAEFYGSHINFWFLKTENGNYIWQDSLPSIENKIFKFDGDLDNFCQKYNVSEPKDKGKHQIKQICGSEVIFEG